MPKNTAPAKSKRLMVVNFFGMLFYLSCLLQWLWASVPFLPPLIDWIDTMQRPTHPVAEPLQPALQFTPSSPLLVVIGAIAVILAIAATVYALIKIPTSIAKTSHVATKTGVQKITALPKYQTLPVAKRRQLTARLILGVKVALCLVPAAVSALSFAMPLMTSYTVALTAALTLAILTVVALSVQLVAAKLLRIPFEKTW